MNHEQLSDAIGRLDDTLIEEALRPRRPWWYAAVAVAACLCVLAVSLLAVNDGGDQPPVVPPAGDVSTSVTTTTTTEEDATTETTDTTTTTTETTTTTATTTTTTTTTAKPSTTTTTTTTTTTKHNSNAVSKVTVTTTTAPLIPTVQVLAQEIPPKMAAYAARGEERTEWYADVKKQQDQMARHNEGMTAYYAQVLPTVLGAARGENRTFSPLSLYLSLGMLAEITDGNSRRQVLDLMGAGSDMDRLMEKCAGLWNGVFIDDTVSACRLSNSLWLRNDEVLTYRQTTVERLAQHYYATVYRGEMGSEEYNIALRDWVNDRTGGMLKGPVSQLKMDSLTALNLVNTLYFKMKWYYSFKETVDGVFHATEGDVIRPFMKIDDLYFNGLFGAAGYGEAFTGVRLPLDGGRTGTVAQYEMVILLPDEGVSADALLADPQALGFIEGDETRATIVRKQEVRLSLPKFDVLSDMDLSESLQLLGVTDVFDGQKADFSAVLTNRDMEVALAEVRHATRVKIDEEGCEAASYTMVRPIVKGIITPGTVLDFTVDRPFMFAVTGPGNTILFAGIIENP